VSLEESRDEGECYEDSNCVGHSTCDNSQFSMMPLSSVHIYNIVKSFYESPIRISLGS
jgi:hypothetical protein